MIWANLLHLSYNMWVDREAPELPNKSICCQPYLRLDKPLWDDILRAMVQAGMNMVLIDLGDGVRYDSHPEIAVENAWSPSDLRRELERIREMGLEPIPKLNFSATHDVWLGPYSRCLSTPEYYGVCRDLMSEAIDIFETPRLFHLGMDEETAEHQAHQEYVVIRQYDLWWHDLLFYVDELRKRGVRAWVWSDYLWHHPVDFFERMPGSVLQSNWYYGSDFSPTLDRVKAYLDLEARGYEQAPTGSNWAAAENFEKTVEFCAEQVPSERLAGFLQTTWRPTTEDYRDQHMQAIEQVGRARRRFEETHA